MGVPPSGGFVAKCLLLTAAVIEGYPWLAATILTGLVPLTIYFISGKLFVRGIAAGAVKG